MAQKSFGGAGTVRKLQTVADYASFYTKVLSGRFNLHYLDAFAGTGEIPYSSELPLISETEDLDKVIRGSARRALQIDKPFDRYVFADLKHKNTVSLLELPNEFPLLRDRIIVQQGDANDITLEFCRSLKHNDRALVFLDPFGNQVNWMTLEAIAATKKVDLWYLFPAGLGVARQITNSGEVLAFSEASLDRLFGGGEWREECITLETKPDLFTGDLQVAQKIATAEGITRYMIQKMGDIFGGGVSQSWLPLGKNGVHKFSLLFACSNPGDNAKKLAQRVAQEIMTRK